MARGIFDPEGFAWKPFGVLTDVLVLSILWLVGSIPLVTVGAASTALYDAVAHGMRRKESGMYRRFLSTYRAELLSSLLQTLAWGALTLSAFFLLRAFTASAAGQPSDAAVVVSVMGLVLLLFLSGMSCWVFPLLSRFTFTFSTLFVSAVSLAFSHVLITFFLALSLWGCVWLCLRLALPVFFSPALLTLLWSVPLERVFAQIIARREASAGRGAQDSDAQPAAARGRSGETED